MMDLSARQLRRALSSAGELAQLRELADFPSVAARLLHELVPCEHAGYNAIDVPRARATVVADPPDAVFEGGAEVLAHFAAQNPIVARAAAGDMSVLRLSDYLSTRELHRTDLYDQVYRHTGLEYQMGVQLPPLRRRLRRPDELIGLSLTRTHRDFSDAERILLGIVGTLLTATLERLHELAMLRAVNSAADPTPTVLIDDAGVIVWASLSAEHRLGLAAGERLPERVRAWLAGERKQTGRQPGTLLIGVRRVQPILVRNAYPDLDAIHFPAAAPQYRADELRPLPLTPRQRDVLVLILQGMTNREIGLELRISPRTAEKHVDEIYARLGVHSRSQAIVATIQRLSD